MGYIKKFIDTYRGLSLAIGVFISAIGMLVLSENKKHIINTYNGTVS